MTQSGHFISSLSRREMCPGNSQAGASHHLVIAQQTALAMDLAMNDQAARASPTVLRASAKSASYWSFTI